MELGGIKLKVSIDDLGFEEIEKCATKKTEVMLVSMELNPEKSLRELRRLFENLKPV